MGTRTQRSGGAEEEDAGAGACSLDIAQSRLRALCISVRCFPRSLPCPKRPPWQRVMLAGASARPPVPQGRKECEEGTAVGRKFFGTLHGPVCCWVGPPCAARGRRWSRRAHRAGRQALPLRAAARRGWRRRGDWRRQR